MDEGSEFKEESFPLEPPSQLRPVIEMQFPEGHELHDVKLMAILKWADSQGLELAPARTTGEYLYERETDAGDLFIGGGIYRNSIGNLVVTCFHCKSDKNECSQFKGHACFRWTNYNYPPRDRKVTWLFVRKWVNWYDEQ